MFVCVFFFSSRRRHTRCALVTGVQTCALPILVFPELALTTFFPRWYIEDEAELDRWYETEMPGAETAPLFAEARRLGIGFSIGYAELVREGGARRRFKDRKSTRLNSSH